MSSTSQARPTRPLRGHWLCPGSRRLGTSAPQPEPPHGISSCIRTQETRAHRPLIGQSGLTLASDWLVVTSPGPLVSGQCLLSPECHPRPLSRSPLCHAVQRLL